MKYRVEGTKISLYFKGPDDDSEIKNWEIDIVENTSNPSFPAPVLKGGVNIKSEGLVAQITNIVARDLKGNIIPIEPDDDDEGSVEVDITEPINAGDGESAWYGQTTWKDYIVESTLSGLSDTGSNGAYPNFQFKLRGESGSYYYIYIDPNGSVNLQEAPSWEYYMGGNASSAPTGGNSVDYKFEMIGNKLSVYANDNLLYIYEETREDTHTQGQVGWETRGVTAVIESLKITLLDKDSEPKPPVTPGAIEILSPKIPVAGVYPISGYKYSPNSWDSSVSWKYTETIEWSPAIQNTFLTDTAYTATVTLTPDSGYSFAGKTITDIGGIYLDAAEYATAKLDGNNLVITFAFPATDSTAVEWEEFENMLFYDDFSGTKLDMNKWDNPSNYNNQVRGGNSTWLSDNISVKDGSLWLRFAKEDAESNWISTAATRTRNKFDNAYGYYEARIKYPTEDPSRSGSWGAFWLMYYKSNFNAGRDGMEIDIVEFAGVHDHWASGGLHWDGYETYHKSAGFMRYDGTPENTIYDGKFHTYALEWTPTEYISYVDGVVSGRMTKLDMQNANGDICENPIYIKFSIESSATGPNWNMGWGGPMPEGTWEDFMEVDYVAVYDRPKSAPAVYITDYATLDLDVAYDEAQAQIKATVKNVNQFVQGTVSGTVYLDTPEGIIAGETSKTYSNLAYGETAVLYFAINPEYVSAAASELIKFNYTVEGLDPVGSAQINFGVVEAAEAIENDTFANSMVIDFAKGTANGGSVSASTLDPADLSATGKLAWDEDYLYAQIVVSDNIHNQTNSAGNRWQDDGVQISIGNNAGWREMEFVLSSSLETAYQQCYNNTTGAAGNTGSVAQGSSTIQSEITRDDEAKTTTYNIKINWAYVGISDPAAGNVGKIAITINDNDGGSRKDLAYFDGISTGSKGQGMGYLILTEIPQHVHDYELTEHDDPTCEENGSSVYTCAGCGDSYTEVDEDSALGHDYAWRKNNDSNEYYCQRCGVVIYVGVSKITGVPTSMKVSETLTLTGAVLPSNATNQTISWSIENAGNTGAMLNNNVLTATTAGTVKVKATIENGLTDTADYEQIFDITVQGEEVIDTHVGVSKITGVPSSMTVGETLTLTGMVLPSNATNQTIGWSIENAGNTGAKLNNNVLTATSAGTIKVKATIENGLTKTTNYTEIFDVTVKAEEVIDTHVGVSKITGVPSSMKASETLTLTGTVSPSNATNQVIKWSIENAGNTGAKLNNNVLTATAAGTVKVKATIENGLTKTTNYTEIFDVTVKAEEVIDTHVGVSKITNVTSSMTVGGKLTLTGTVSPSNATNQIISWSIENAGNTGAKLNNNVLTATSAGTVKVKATIENGLTKTTDYTEIFEITVNAKIVKPDPQPKPDDKEPDEKIIKNEVKFVLPIFNTPGHKVIFKNTGDTSIPNQIIKHGSSVTKPDDPVMDGYKFVGWYYGETYLVKYNFEGRVTKDIIICAKWVKN